MQTAHQNGFQELVRGVSRWVPVFHEITLASESKRKGPKLGAIVSHIGPAYRSVFGHILCFLGNKFVICFVASFGFVLREVNFELLYLAFDIGASIEAVRAAQNEARQHRKSLESAKVAISRLGFVFSNL